MSLFLLLAFFFLCPDFWNNTFRGLVLFEVSLVL